MGWHRVWSCVERTGAFAPCFIATVRIFMPLTVYIIEPHPAVRESFLFLVGPMTNLTVVGSASSYEAAACDLAQQEPDLVLIGIAGASDAPIRWLRAQCPESRVLAATAFQTGLTPSVARQAGADLCVSRAHGAPTLLPSLRKMVTGLEGSSCSSTEGGPVSIDDLAGRDRKILDALGSGRTPEEVATWLGISLGDVQRRQDALKSMFGANSLLHLRQIALRTGWREWQSPSPSNSPTSAP